MHRIIKVERVLRKVFSTVSCSVSAVRSDQVAQGFLHSSLGKNPRKKNAQNLETGYFFTSKNLQSNLKTLEKREF